LTPSGTTITFEFQAPSLMAGFKLQEPFQEPLAPPHVLQVAPTHPGRHAAHPEAVPERVKLTSDQAISIFNHRETKTKHTAALLSAEYGISSKAIRDIWTRRSWAHDTRLYWTLLDQQWLDSAKIKH